MKKRILDYIAAIDRMLDHPDENTDWDEEIKNHLVQIKFFMHERLVHELVMILFAIGTVMVILHAVSDPQPGLLILVMAMMVLLVPYVMHYYLLENSVQYMYKQYDKMLEYKTGKRYIPN